MKLTKEEAAAISYLTAQNWILRAAALIGDGGVDQLIEQITTGLRDDE